MSEQNQSNDRMAELEAELQRLREESAANARARKEREEQERQAREAQENTFYGQPLPNDEAGWQYTIMLVRERAAQNENLAPQVAELESRYRNWKQRQQQSEIDSVRNREAFLRRLDRAIPDEGDPTRQVALSAFEGGMSIEDLENNFLKPYAERIRGEANQNAVNATRETLASGSAIEGGERSVNDGGDAGDETPETPSEQVSKSVAELFQKRGPSYGKIFG